MSDILFRDYNSVATTLAVLLIIGGVEKNPGPGVQAEKIMHVLCSGCDRNPKLGTHCDMCGLQFPAVVMLKYKWQRAGNGSEISVDQTDSGC